MDDKKRRLLLLIGGIIALLILGLILFFFLFGGEEEAAPPPPPVSQGEVPPPIPEAKPTVERLKEYTTPARTTLQAVAAREDVYKDPGQWWALFAANPKAVRYLFRDAVGNWVALVPQGSRLTIAEPRSVPAAEQQRLRRGFGHYAVQFGSYTVAANARELLGRLAEGEPGQDFYLSHLSVDGIARQRVRAGLFSRWDEAEDLGQTLMERYDEITDYYTVAVPGGEQRSRQQELERLYGAN